MTWKISMCVFCPAGDIDISKFMHFCSFVCSKWRQDLGISFETGSYFILCKAIVDLSSFFQLALQEYGKFLVQASNTPFDFIAESHSPGSFSFQSKMAVTTAIQIDDILAQKFLDELHNFNSFMVIEKRTENFVECKLGGVSRLFFSKEQAQL